ncbi:conserved hypothetical protein [Coccidioides posadasii str. Silveira]|uniref:non-specific serine/threonine protein kinase n=1 Tax=Coccidioides posadasii (strain RMSCC 757 / Silveira) TaxID=443226 RepID=E9CS57_COCPS|nr:conserved hypothetical protein [Coccidioides posadasii str. Silveira]
MAQSKPHCLASHSNQQTDTSNLYATRSGPTSCPTPPVRERIIHNQRPGDLEPDYYKTRGFHPISLGDTFHSVKYTVLGKLGYGQYSTVWLARDSKYQRYPALKVLRADCYGGSHDIFEKEILSRILEVSNKSSHGGRNHVLSLLDQFKHTGPNGDHVCFVLDVLGHHLDFQAAKYEDGQLPLKSVKVITRQLLLGLDFLHRECGIIHTDLKPTNILLELENPNHAISQYLSEVPARADCQRGITVPLREVITTPLRRISSHTKRILIIATWGEDRLSNLIQSPALRAPEVTIGAPWDTGVDIWSLGFLFSGEASENGTWTAEDDHLARIIEILGPFPLDFIKKGNRGAELFDKQGNLLRISNLNPRDLSA